MTDPILICIDVALQLTSLLIALLASMTFSSKPIADLLPYNCAFFNCFTTSLYLAMLANPNKPIDLLCVTVPQKYFAVIALIVASIVLPYDWISIFAVLIVGTTLHLIAQKQVLSPAVAGVEKLFKCGEALDCGRIGYVTAVEGMKNA